MNKHNGIANKSITLGQLLQSVEYKECESKQSIKCEIQDPVYGEEHKDIEPLRIRIFKITGISMRRVGSSADISSDADEIYGNAGSHSNSSLNIKGPQDLKAKDNKEETKKDLINLMNANLIKREEKEEEDPKNKREETKTTEKLPGNVVTTESRMETLEAKQGVMSKFTGEQKKLENIKSVSEEKKEEKKSSYNVTEALKKKNIEETKKIFKSGSQRILKIEEKKKEVVEESSTPRMDLGNLKGPESMAAGSNIADVNTVQPKEDSLFDSESHKSTGKANAKEESKEEKILHSDKVSRNLTNSEKLSDKAMKFAKQVNTVMEEEKSPKKKKGGSYKDKDEEMSDIIEATNKEIEENKEKVVPLDKAKIDSKIAQAEKNKMKVHSVLDDTGIIGIKQSPEEKKASVIQSSTMAKEPQDDIKIISEEQHNIIKKASKDMDNSYNLAKRKSSQIEGKDHQKKDETSMKGRKKYASKIITSPLYEGGEHEVLEIPEYHPSEDEIKLRKALLAHEKKQNKETEKGRKKSSSEKTG